MSDIEWIWYGSPKENMAVLSPMGEDYDNAPYPHGEAMLLMLANHQIQQVGGELIIDNNEEFPPKIRFSTLKQLNAFLVNGTQR